MMVRLLAEIRTNQAKTEASQAKTDANLKEIKEAMRAGQKLLKEEMVTKFDAHHERMIARIDSQLEKMEASLGRTEATDLAASPEEKECVAVHEAAVETSGALKEQYGDRNLAVWRRGQPNKRTQGNGGPRKKLAVSCGGMNRRAIPARRKGHCCQGQACAKNP
jgi:hypothetical protein